MSKKIIIAVDIDDVLADSTEALRVEVNKRLGVNLTPEHYQIPGEYQDYYAKVWSTHGLAERISMKELEPQMEAEQSHLKLRPGAKEALQILATKYKILIITSRQESWRSATERWLHSNLGDVFSEVIFTTGKETTKHMSKGEICARYGVSWLIDDNVEHAQSALNEGIGVILYGEYGWHYKPPAGVIRCKDWAAVVEYLDGK